MKWIGHGFIIYQSIHVDGAEQEVDTTFNNDKHAHYVWTLNIFSNVDTNIIGIDNATWLYDLLSYMYIILRTLNYRIIMGIFA